MKYDAGSASPQHSFWDWFACNASSIAAHPEDRSRIEEIDSRVHESWPELSWEIGPDKSGQWYFALSPNLNRELTRKAKDAISIAPVVHGWRFYATRQRKTWSGCFILEGESGSVDIDTRNWTYVLLRYPEGSYDIVLYGPEAGRLSDNDRWQAAAIALEGYLGEQRLLDSIHEFGFERSPADYLFGKDKPIANLLRAFGLEAI